MVLYSFKAITVVPSGMNLVDIVLSKTQRKTPTIVHKGYAITRLRQFYTRKVKFAQQTFRDKLTGILGEFPILDEIHPFYADLMNVLYDRDHYKLALGQLNVCRNLIDNIGKDYVRLIKYADSLFRCKQLKRAALGRMCTLMKKQNASLAYLEQVRQHLARLPSIDPNERTLLVTGYPNVGKSSFLNKITRADVDVQPYAFTTKSLFIGHTDYKYLRWQVVDTPGILDHPLDERNTIEMQSITALAHLRAAVLYIIDISEQCGYTFEAQLALFDSIRPLFQGKPLIVVLNKIDVVKPEELSDERKAALTHLETEHGAVLVPMSNFSEDGVMTVKSVACERLLEQRVERKLKGARAHDVLARVHVAMPKSRDGRRRGVTIPSTVAAVKASALDGRVVKPDNSLPPVEKHLGDLMMEWDGSGKPPGFGSTLWQERYQLADDEWRFDTMPEIKDGKNIIDWYDPDIAERLDALEEEEAERVRALEEELAAAKAADDDNSEVESELDSDEEKLVKQIRDKKKLLALNRRRTAAVRNSRPIIPRTGITRSTGEFKEHLQSLGIDADTAGSAATAVTTRARSKSREGRKRKRSESRGRSKSRVSDVEKEARSKSRTRTGVTSLARSVSRGDGFRDAKQRKRASSLGRKLQKQRNRAGRRGEADTFETPALVKHMNTGKRGIGKTDRR
eukprot:CAMPEP_0168590364 /NCGR_PEP_ID=MMETSP0420-20121227/6529_1 /TAXON_ID=498008 /ORGANISM="Pessonella sp." /LENGTH=680 /DNA_ID=CAMNT_0008626019 /DNA_START=26 /DNA_END=2068 /DNA_ORIENTATION=-